MASLGDAVRSLGRLGLAFIGVVLFLAALFFYNIHANIEDDMECICDSGEIFVEILTYEDCNEAQQSSNLMRTWAIGCGFFGLVFMYGAHKSHNDSKKVESNNKEVYVQPQHNLQPTSGISDQERYQTLEKLDSMRDKGIISEEEFQKEKDKILNS